MKDLSKLQKEMQGKKYLYEVYADKLGGGDVLLGFVLADTDAEGVRFALQAFSSPRRKVARIRKDHWGKGPMIQVLQVVENEAHVIEKA